jgi:ABC-type transport system substrate-binding protein
MAHIDAGRAGVAQVRSPRAGELDADLRVAGRTDVLCGQPVRAGDKAAILRRIRANLHTVPFGQFFAMASNPRSKIQLGLTGWGADIPAASDFFLPVLTCRSFYQDPGSYANYGGFCDPHADQLASQAQAEQQADPAAARRLWAQVDRVVTDQAPWVPIFNRSSTMFVSARVGNYQESPVYGPLLDQIWVR